MKEIASVVLLDRCEQSATKLSSALSPDEGSGTGTQVLPK